MVRAMTTNLQSDVNVKKSIDWIIALSIFLIVLGILSILLPGIASAFFTSVIGWITLIGGIVMIIQSFQSRAVRAIWLIGLYVGISLLMSGISLLAAALTARRALAA